MNIVGGRSHHGQTHLRNPYAETESDNREDPIDGADRGEGEEVESDGRRKTSNKNPNRTAKSHGQTHLRNHMQKQNQTTEKTQSTQSTVLIEEKEKKLNRMADGK
jgi:hypothetical protein